MTARQCRNRVRRGSHQIGAILSAGIRILLIQTGDHRTRSRHHFEVTRVIRFNAFDTNCVAHQSPGLWKHPEDQSWRYKDVRYWTELAELLERGRFDGLFSGSAQPPTSSTPKAIAFVAQGTDGLEVIDDWD